MFDTIRLIWQAYSMTAVSLILYWICTVWLILSGEGKKGPALLLYVVLVPLFVCLLRDTLLLPTAPLVCFAGTCIVRRVRDSAGMKKAWITLLCCGIIIQSGVMLRYSPQVLSGGMNQYKIAATVGRLADFITADEKLTNPYVIAPNEISTRIQEYDPSIAVCYYNGFEYSAADLDYLRQLMEFTGSNCLIIPQAYDDEEYWKGEGYRMIVILDGYTVYART